MDLKNNGLLIKNIDNPTKEEIDTALKNTVYALEYVKSPTEEQQLFCVKIQGHTLKSIKNPSDEVVREAILNNPLAIEHVLNPSVEMQMLAFEKEPLAILNIKNPCKEVLDSLREVDKKGKKINFIKKSMERNKGFKK